MKKNKLLLVNDEETMQEIFAAMLAETGWQIEPALDGNEALRMYRKRGPYDLVLTDILHPGPDGIEVVSRIRERNPKQAIAVVAAIWGKTQSLVRHRFKIPLLPMPFERQQLVKLVESATKPQLRILMVAGDPVVKMLTVTYSSFEIELESTGNKALRHYSEHGPYDMVVTGYHHRGLNGVDLASAIRRANPLQRMVMVTNESASVVRSFQRKLRDIPVVTGKSLADAMLKMGEAKIAADRAMESALPSSIRERIEGRRKSSPPLNPMDVAFCELHMGGAQALLALLDGGASVPAKRRILEVSDSEGTREMNAAICEKRGFEVVQASQGEEALKLYQKSGAFAAVFTDLYWYDEIPEPPLRIQTIRDGIQLALAIRRIAPEQRIVIHTASSTVREQMPEELRDVLVLQKPYRLKELELFLENL
jgi:CheY-like chemotaxis protein